MANTMYIHYCGGAGINVARNINSMLEELGEGFCNIEALYIDSSENNIGDVSRENFWRINANAFARTGAVDGSGGERATNSALIVEDVKGYLDHHQFSTEQVGEYHVVVFSGAGGTGSVTGPMVISNLRQRGIPVIGVVIGDSSNGLSCKNTLNTISTLDSISKRVVKKPISIIYYNNHSRPEIGPHAKEKAVNTAIYNALTTISVFLSGDNEDIDTKDMINFISPDKFTTISVKSAVYNIKIYDGKVTPGANEINLIGRTLTVPGVDVGDAVGDLTLLQHKNGKVVAPDAVETFQDLAPITMLLVGNVMVEEHRLLNSAVEEYEIIQDNLISADLDGTSEADDNGLVF